MVYKSAVCSAPHNGNFTDCRWGWGLASSNDLIHWSKCSSNPIEQDPSKMAQDGVMFMTFNGIDYCYHRATGSLFTERTALDFNNYNFNYEVENSSFHIFGNANGNAWTSGNKSFVAGSTHVPSPTIGAKSPATESIMTYGPYTTAIPTGANIASFKLKIDKRKYRYYLLSGKTISGYYDVPTNIARIDVCQSGSSVMLASRLISMPEIGSFGKYAVVKIPYINTVPGATTEFRVWTMGNTYNLSVDNITSSNRFHQTYEAETDLRYDACCAITGSNGGDGWQAWHTAVDTITATKQGFKDAVTPVESYTLSDVSIEMDSIIAGGTIAWGRKENPTTGLCPVDALPGYNALKANSKLPDPFMKLDGTRITKKSEWACRREEIYQQALHYIYGDKPVPAKGFGFRYSKHK